MPLTVGAAVFAVVLGVGVLPINPYGAGTGDLGPAGFPDRVADYSYLTGTVSSSPPGRAIATYQHGYGVELMDFPQALVLAADGDVYRRLNLAEGRGGPETQGDAGPSRLSPDGTRTAVGRYDTRSPDLVVLELATGRKERYAVAGGRSAVPLAWSPDSSLVAYLTTAGSINPYSGSAITGEIGVLDTQTGTARLLPGPAGARAAAFSPDGTELAIHRLGNGSVGSQDWFAQMAGGAIDIVNLDGTPDRQIPLPVDLYLNSHAAWSPDGALLAMGVSGIGKHGIVFLDASGADGPVPAPLPRTVSGWHGILGWTGPRELLVLGGDERSGDREEDLHWLTALPVDGGEPRRLSAVPAGGNFGVGAFQLATGLLPDLEIRYAADADRGKLPLPLRVGTALVVGGLAFAATELVVRRRKKSRPSAP